MIMNDLMDKPLFNRNSNVSCSIKPIKESIDSTIKSIPYLNLDNAHKMIGRFLSEKNMSKEELAGSLDVTVRNLNQLFSRKMPAGLMCKINLPLVKLYCSTRW